MIVVLQRRRRESVGGESSQKSADFSKCEAQPEFNDSMSAYRGDLSECCSVELSRIRIVEIGMVGQIVEGRAEFQPLSLAKPELPLNGKVGIPGARSAQNTDTAAAESPRGVLNESCCIEPGIHLFLPEGIEVFSTAEAHRRYRTCSRIAKSPGFQACAIT